MLQKLIKFQCTKACDCKANGIRQPLLSLTCRDLENENYRADDVAGQSFSLLVYPVSEHNSIVICSSCGAPWTMDVKVTNQVLHEGDHVKFLSELLLQSRLEQASSMRG